MAPTHLEVLALDPGEKVGWARASILPDGEWSDLRHGINHLKDMALGLADGIAKYDVVIYETWRLFPAAAKTMIGNDMQSSQFIGMVRLLAWQHPALRLISQGPNVKKTAEKTMPPRLREILENEPASHDDAHNVDAMLHLWAWTWTNYVTKDVAA